MVEETHGTPILIGRPEVVEACIERFGLKIRPEQDFEQIDPESYARYRDCRGTYHEIMRRRGVTPDLARAIMRTNSTAIAAVAVHRGDADGVICGTFGQYRWLLRYVTEVLASRELHPVGAMSPVLLDKGPTCSSWRSRSARG